MANHRHAANYGYARNRLSRPTFNKIYNLLSQECNLPSAATKPEHAPTLSRPEGNFAGGKNQTLLLCLALIAATLAFYNPVAHDGFVILDDIPYIISNPPVRAGLTWATVKWSFSTFHAGNWHPLTWLSHALDCQIFGLNPAGHHYVSLLFHAANALLLFLLLQEATTLAWPSFIVAALFALHPANVESVAWAAERKNVLSMFFFLLALWAYTRYARRGALWRYSAVVLCFALGLMSKPQVIPFPCVLLLWDYWPLRRMFPDLPTAHPPTGEVGKSRSLPFLLFEKIPLFLMAIAASIVTVLAQRSGDSVRTLSEVSFTARLENAIVSYARYLAILAWPAHLAPLYPHPGNSIPLWQVTIGAILLLALTAMVLRWRGRRYLAMGWFWFLGVLVPMIGIVQVGEQALADRYLYIPMIGIFIAVVWAAWELVDEKRLSKLWIVAPALIVTITFGLLTYRQLAYWKNGETLWRYTLSVTRQNYMAHANLAMALARDGRAEQAIPEFEAAESLHNYPLPEVLTMGVYLQNHGHVADAIRMYEKVVNNADDPQLRASAWTQLGSAYAQIQNYDQANRSYDNALQLDSNNVTALVGSGLIAEHNHDWSKAIAQLNHALEIQSSDVGFLLLADCLKSAGRLQDSEVAEISAEKISSDFDQARKAASDAERYFAANAVD